MVYRAGAYISVSRPGVDRCAAANVALLQVQVLRGAEH